MIQKEKLLDAEEKFKSCSALFIALGDPIRQKILLDLADSGTEGINVSQLSGKSILSRPAISHHLKVLKDSGLIEPVKHGTQIFYRITIKKHFESIKQLMLVIEDILHDEECE